MNQRPPNYYIKRRPLFDDPWYTDWRLLGAGLAYLAVSWPLGLLGVMTTFTWVGIQVAVVVLVLGRAHQTRREMFWRCDHCGEPRLTDVKEYDHE